MSFTLEQLTEAYPHQLWVKLTSQDLQKSLPNSQDFSHKAAVYRAYLNCLCIHYLFPLFPDLANVEELPQIESQDQLNSLWEFINGTGIEFLGHRLIIIPTETLDLDEFLIEQEWVDIPELAGDYYLAVQVNLEREWLRVWGFTTHEKIKAKAKYDESDRTYSLEAEDLFENLNSLWVSLKLCPKQELKISPLSDLFPQQIERLMVELKQPLLYSPRLKFPFAQWGKFLAEKTVRNSLYQQRIGKRPNQLIAQIFSDIWLTLEELRQLFSWNSVTVKLVRSRQENHNSKPTSIRGRLIDLGMQLAGHPMALILHFTPEIDGKYDILLQVYPGESHPYLPPGVQLIVLEENGDVFLEAQSRKSDNWIQLEFRGEAGERFSVKVAFGDANIVEDFVI